MISIVPSNCTTFEKVPAGTDKSDMLVTVKVAVYGREEAVPPAGERTAVAVPIEGTLSPTFADPPASTIGGLKVKIRLVDPCTFGVNC